MFNLDYITKEDIKEYNPNWLEILDHLYKILIVGSLDPGKHNLINHEPDIDKSLDKDKNIDKDPYEAKYQLLINKRKSTGLKYLNDLKALIEYSNNVDDIYIEEYNPNRKRKILIVFDDMIADMHSNKKLNPIVTELSIRGKKLNICLVFITQSYFVVPKNIRLNSTHCFVIKIPNKRELKQTAFNYLSDADFQDFMNLYKKCTAKRYSFWVIDATLASDNFSGFRENLLERT